MSKTLTPEQTTVVNLYKGPYDVYIGRAGKGQSGHFGNPFQIMNGEKRGATLERFRKYFYDRIATDPDFKKSIQELKGKRLGCFCKPKACHGDIIAEYLNQLTK